MTRPPSVPLFSAELAARGLDLTAVLGQVIASERYVLGPWVQAFESAFAAYVGVGHAIGVANGTDALELALRGLDIGPGQRVLTVANAGFYGSSAILAVGAEPVYADVDPVTLNLAPQVLADMLGSQSIHAVIATHLYGRMADMAVIAPLCRVAGVSLIEDCAQAHGARLAGRAAGAWGDVACFSFYPTKNLGALGDGGALVTGIDALADRLRALMSCRPRCLQRNCPGWTSQTLSGVRLRRVTPQPLPTCRCRRQWLARTRTWPTCTSYGVRDATRCACI